MFNLCERLPHTHISFHCSKSIITLLCYASYRHAMVCTVRHITCHHCYCTVLYCTILYCTVLYCTVLYCTVLYCTVLYCTVLYCTVLYYTVLYCTVLYCTVRHYITSLSSHFLFLRVLCIFTMTYTPTCKNTSLIFFFVSLSVLISTLFLQMFFM